MNEDEKDNQRSCCGDSHCCPPTAVGTGGQKGRWRTIVFTVVILLACAAMAYSLFVRDNSDAASGCCPGGAPAMAIGIEDDRPTATLNETLAGSDPALVVLLHIGDILSEQEVATIGDVKTAIESRGGQIRVWTLAFGDPAFLEALDRFKVTAFPAILVHGGNGTVVIHREEIRKDTILSILQQESAAVRSDALGGGTK